MTTRNVRVYSFDLQCPRCRKLDTIEMAINDIDKVFNCGNCLVEKMDIVAMNILRVNVKVQ